MEGFVYVIESPSGDDVLDGRREGNALTESLKLAQIPTWYSMAVNKKSLAKALGERLAQAWEVFKKPPVLHFSMHGSQEGIYLTSNEFISWSELRYMLNPLMQAMNGGLLVCMSTCYGNNGYSMAMNEDSGHTFWGLVGNKAETPWSDSAVAYISFYHLLFKGFDIGTCIESMKVASGNHNFIFNSGHDLKARWLQYIANHSAGLEGRLNQATKQVKVHV